MFTRAGLGAVALAAACLASVGVQAQERTIKIHGFGAQSGDRLS